MAELRVLSAGAVKRGVARVAADFERATGVRVGVEFQTAPQLKQRLAAGERAEVIVAPPGVLDDLAREGRLVAGSRGFIGRSRMGVVVHASAAVPPLGDTAAFARALRDAGGIVHNRASSGAYAATLLEKLGLTAATGCRIAVVDSGSAVMEYVAAHPDHIGLAQISEVMVLVDKGCPVRLAAPLPDEIQNLTHYEAAALAEAGRELAQALTSDAAKEVFAATGID